MKQLVDGDMRFGDIEADELYLKMKTYAGEEDTNLDVFIELVDDGQPRAEGEAPFLMTSSEIFIANSLFQLIDENDFIYLSFSRFSFSCRKHLLRIQIQ